MQQYRRKVLSKAAILVFVMGILLPLGIMAEGYEAAYLYRVPSAKLSKDRTLAAGMLGSVGFRSSKSKFSAEGFFNGAFTDRIAVNGFFHHNYSSVGIQMALWEYFNPKTNVLHNFGAGFSNANFTAEELPINYPLVGFFANYTMDLQGTRIHFGVGSNTSRDPNSLAFVGADFDLEKGLGFIEWDGKNINLGYYHTLEDNMQLMMVFTPDFEETVDRESRVFAVGLRLKEALDFTPKTKGKIVDKMPDQKEIDIPRTSDPALAASIERLKQASSYYYQGQYELARDELEKVANIFPSADTYQRLGSVYAKLKDHVNAAKNWKRAIKYNPGDSKLKEFLQGYVEKHQLTENDIAID